MKNIIKENIKDMYLYFNGPKILNPDLPKSSYSILFVCLGNICRSPFAEHIANKIAYRQSMGIMSFFSAGIEVPTSLSSTQEALTASGKFGINLKSHSSRLIDNIMAESYHMIIGMETLHVKRLREIFPDQQHKIYLLPLFDKNINKHSWSYYRCNIADPYGKSVDVYYECFLRIERCTENLLSIIQNTRGK
jgi:protein-tyrosine phosphatase